MGRWERSWSITRTSFDVLRKDSEMIWFPILSGIFSILFSVALIIPSFVLDVFGSLGVGLAGYDPGALQSAFSR